LHYTGTAALNATVQARDFFWFPPADPRFRRVGKKNFALFAGAADNNSKSDFVQIISKKEQKMAKIFLMLALTVLFASTTQVSQSEEASVARGKTLFNDPALGGSTNPKSCNTCHEDGKGLEKAGAREDLAAMINTCIEQALQGKKLDERTPEMGSLQLYIKSLGK
jgi:cytochrome c peroxidase